MSKNTAAKSQSDKFKDAAREAGVDLDEDKLKEALRRMGEPRPKGDGGRDG